jgi:hypothetical protein
MVFAGVAFTLVGNLFTSTVKTFLGADLIGEMLDKNIPLNEEGIRDYLNEMKDRGIVSDFTFISSDLVDIIGNGGTNFNYGIYVSSLASNFRGLV